MLPSPGDSIEITNLLARYCLLLDVDDIDAWVGLFTSMPPTRYSGGRGRDQKEFGR